MSIEFSPAFDSARSSLARTRPRKTVSPRRVAANRRNARQSTGPRTEAGKRRSSRNAIKHGLCSKYAVLEGECPATYATFVAEIEEELQPRTTMQRALVPHIANLLWRIDRLPEAQVKMFDQELNKCGKGKRLTSSEVLAKRFSDEPTSNGFLLMGRYERGLHNELHRLLRQFEQSAKRRAAATSDWPDDEPPVPPEPAITDHQLAAQEQAFARRAQALDRGEPPANEYESAIDRAILFDREQQRKRTQSKPSETPAGGAESAKCAISDAAPATERSQGEGDGGGGRTCQSPRLPVASFAPKIVENPGEIQEL